MGVVTILKHAFAMNQDFACYCADEIIKMVSMGMFRKLKDALFLPFASK